MRRARPREIWVGVGIAVLGMVVMAVTMTYVHSALWLWVGLAVIAVGLTLAWYAGIMRDVRRGPHGATAEFHDVTAHDVRRGVSPATSQHTTAATPPKEPVTANAGAPEGMRLPPASMPVKIHWTAGAMVLLGGWMIVSPLVLFYPDSELTNDVILRDYAVAAILVMFGVLLRSLNHRAVLAAVPAAAAAVLLLAVAFNAPLTVRATVNEIASASLAVALAVGYLLLRGAKPERDDRSGRRQVA